MASHPIFSIHSTFQIGTDMAGTIVTIWVADTTSVELILRGQCQAGKLFFPPLVRCAGVLDLSLFNCFVLLCFYSRDNRDWEPGRKMDGDRNWQGLSNKYLLSLEKVACPPPFWFTTFLFSSSPRCPGTGSNDTGWNGKVVRFRLSLSCLDCSEYHGFSFVAHETNIFVSSVAEVDTSRQGHPSQSLEP